MGWELWKESAEKLQFSGIKGEIRATHFFKKQDKTFFLFCLCKKLRVKRLKFTIGQQENKKLNLHGLFRKNFRKKISLFPVKTRQQLYHEPWLLFWSLFYVSPLVYLPFAPAPHLLIKLSCCTSDPVQSLLHQPV